MQLVDSWYKEVREGFRKGAVGVSKFVGYTMDKDGLMRYNGVSKLVAPMSIVGETMTTISGTMSIVHGTMNIFGVILHICWLSLQPS